jgi:ornithine cyclodeaminase/alanine dehydrogenase-like protein (mu-crystallin family)
MSILLVNDELVERSISASECLAAVEHGFRLEANGQISSTYAGTTYQEGAASFHLYAAYVPGYGLGAKVLGAYEDNPELGEPYIHATVILLDPRTGRPQAFLDGRYLTALRTAAAVALGARCLSRPDSRVLGILGTGLQARTHLLCHLAIHPFERVLIWGRTPEHVAAYLSEMRPKVTVPIESLASPEAVCGEADVLTCTTRARNPLFPASAVRSGTHIGVAGPLRSGGTEIPLDLVHRSDLYVDDRGKFQKLWDPGTAPPIEEELGEVIVGRTEGRTSASTTTVFKPVGMAFEDVVAGYKVVNRLRGQEQGQEVLW